jgi:hypothetical protein
MQRMIQIATTTSWVRLVNSAWERKACREHDTWSYRYQKKIQLDESLPGFRIEYQLTNLGSRAMEQTYYSHNFISIDDQPIDPQYQSAGAGIRITGDVGLARFCVWTTDRVVCPEPFVAIQLGPAQTFQWTDQYELLVTPEQEKP